MVYRRQGTSHEGDKVALALPCTPHSGNLTPHMHTYIFRRPPFSCSRVAKFPSKAIAFPLSAGAFTLSPDIQNQSQPKMGLRSLVDEWRLFYCSASLAGSGTAKKHKARDETGVEARGGTVPQQRSPLFLYPALPRREMTLCWAIALGTLGYAWYCVWLASAKWHFRMGQPAAVHELPLLGRRFKDESNWEWFRWSPFALHYLPFLLAHSALFNLLPRLLSDSVWPNVYTTVSMAICAHIFTAQLLFCSVAQGLLILACTLLFRRTLAVWVSALPLLYVVMNRTDWVSDDPFLVLLFVSYTLLSYISFCLELARELSATRAARSSRPIPLLVSRMLLYVFYQPYLFSLIVLYPDFERQLAQRQQHPVPWTTLLFRALRVAFWWCVCELLLHFFYFGLIGLDTGFMAALPKDQFVSIGMAMGAFFHLKYVVIFGLPALFALLDGMEPPPGPICISRVALYSKIWRGFDRGLYAFFKAYIFVPICTPSFSLPRKLLGLSVSFTFVLLWHGFHHHNIVWIALNIAEMFIEFGAKAFYSVSAVRAFRSRVCSDCNFRRLLGWLQIVPFAIGLYSNFYFLGGSAVGWLFVQRIFLEETVTVRWPFLLLIACGYFYMQIAMEMERSDGGPEKCPMRKEGQNGGQQEQEGDRVKKRK